MRNEKTGKRAASLAGQILADTRGLAAGHRLIAMNPEIGLLTMQLLSGIGYSCRDLGTVAELRTICGSDLTQAQPGEGPVVKKNKRK